MQIPSQIKIHVTRFHLINKGNGAGAHCDLKDKNPIHNWTPKFSLCYCNFNFNNSCKMYQLYCKIMNDVVCNWNTFMMLDVILEGFNACLQIQEPMKEQEVEHPIPIFDLTHIDDCKNQ